MSLKSFFSLCVRRRKCKVVVLSPSDDAYYHWLMVIGAAVFYNWTLLVVRLGSIIVTSCISAVVCIWLSLSTHKGNFDVCLKVYLFL